ncbi:MAG: H-NS histone family protein [Mitsuaria chitosanitabida]|uniref:H-NS family nucleoid-associated regulatory protein n=1 Tax=Roseateles chitosanitabidus TaxID=65048 RepID=UPI001B101312|nr:H-NS family nucleoid-associated regulatory protein [Roseateles chitosanitabidus]MBO9687100.1 H-NS histone family protein [Roseateles chitosanitabidus]
MPKSLQQVLSQIDKLQREANSIRAKEVAGVISRIQEAIRHYNLTPADLFGTTSKKTSAAPKGKRGGVAKYQSADGKTWSGVGKRPNWFVAAIEAGKTPEELLVDGRPGASTEQSKPTRSRAAKRKSTTKERRTGEPKYHNGEGKTWTGKGTRPGWFVAALGSGKTAEDLLISKS